MSGPLYVGAETVAQLLDGRGTCPRCETIVALPGAQRLQPINAAVLDPAGQLHAGDVVTGKLACGANGDHWTWLVATRRPALGGQDQRH